MGVLSLQPNNENFDECNFYEGKIAIHFPKEKCWETQKEKSNDLENKNINDEIQEENNSNQISENKLEVDEKFEKEKIEKDSEKKEEESEEINIIINNKENELGINFSFNNTSINNINNNIVQQNYFFPLVGLINVGSTGFMNATLQFLLHVSELSNYFLYEYPKDKNFLKSNCKNILTKGDLSNAYYEVVKSVDKLSKDEIKFSYNSYSPSNFKTILGKYNPQFSQPEANDSKDLILYLLQTFHEELNYFGDKATPKNIPLPDPTLRTNSFNYFTTTYQSTNFSKISQLFFGTYENTIKCSICNTIYYSYQKFEFITFSTYNYKNNKFSILNGFNDSILGQKLEGENQYMCNKCKKLVDAELFTKIIEPPIKLIINIDYGKDKINSVQKFIFEHELDITDFLSFKFDKNVKYKLSSICSHRGFSGPTGLYYTFCKNKENNTWYKFDNSSCGEIDNYEINRGDPYLLIYERI